MIYRKFINGSEIENELIEFYIESVLEILYKTIKMFHGQKS